MIIIDTFFDNLGLPEVIFERGCQKSKSACKVHITMFDQAKTLNESVKKNLSQ